MAVDWRKIPFAQLLTGPVRNGIYKRKEFHGRGIKIVNMGELFAYPRLRNVPMKRVVLSESEKGRFCIQSGDLLFARRSLVAEGAGKCTVVLDVSESTTFESSIIRARPDTTKSDPLFLYYYFKSPRGLHALDSIRRQVAVAGITGSDLARLNVQIPPLSHQRAIARTLGMLDDKIELNRRMNETLEAMARALFKSWFVDFDPVRAKAEGRDSGLPQSLADLFPARLVQSELGRIPKGWPVEALADHCKPVKGVSYKGNGLGDDGVPLHNLNSIYEGGGYKYEGIKHYSGEHAERHAVIPGDVIVANTEQGHERLLIGYAAVVPNVYGNYGIASHHIYRVRPKPGSGLEASYLCFLLNSPQMHDVVSRFANGTTVNMLPIDALQKPPIVCPPRPLVEAFDALAVNARQRSEELLLESRILAALRDLLLPKLISGEIRLRDAEKTVEAVA